MLDELLCFGDFEYDCYCWLFLVFSGMKFMWMMWVEEFGGVSVWFMVLCVMEDFGLVDDVLIVGFVLFWCVVLCSYVVFECEWVIVLVV